MDELETNFFIGLSYHFGGPKNYMSGTAGVGISQRFGNFNPGANLAVNFYNGGLGSLSNDSSFNIDTVLTGKLTIGDGKGNPMDVYPLHLNSGTGLEDNYKYSATIGTNFIFNNHERNQHVGFVQLRASDFSFQTYNDFSGFKKLGISDGNDRWWTGGGNITLGAKNSDYQFVIASDVFTADTDSENDFDRNTANKNLETFLNNNQNNSKLERLKNRVTDYTPATASQVDQTFLDLNRDGVTWTPEAHSFDLNQGRTSFRLKTPDGTFGMNSLGKSNMYSQDIIHRIINFHLIPSERPNYWEFQYSPTINQF
ncbi:polymorphic toxin type 23 domain-containing protein [Flavobacterium sp. J27]|uniref:polymorphic toxin type 23 domain-containing protein n=1 Tax=Flavobacterium sp. J27 TaxID=2060419 RepID=UPI00102F957E|nr:polymorphic toxin type 23 domain-containing protein [Flavobacterium sp. J27]